MQWRRAVSSVVVDTSAWIHCFRSAGDKLTQCVRRLVREDNAVLVGPVLLELQRGVRGVREKRRLADMLGVLPYVEVERADWEGAAESLRKLRAHGITLPATDALIAVVAERRGMSVLTLDRHFDHLPARRFLI